jgi:single-stranded DNA-binding protein
LQLTKDRTDLVPLSQDQSTDGYTETPNRKEITAMNIAVLSGSLARNAVCKGSKNKALAFTVITPNAGNGNGDNPPSYIPCVLFNPSPEIESLFVDRGKGLSVLLQGRINTNSFEENGKKRYQTEVIVWNKSLVVQEH